MDGLRAQADAGNEYAAGYLAGLLAERGDLNELYARADAGDEDAAWRLAELLADAGDLDGLRARADAGDEDAAGLRAWLLADRLAEAGDLDGLRAQADGGSRAAGFRLAGLLEDAGDLDGLRAWPTHVTSQPPCGWPIDWPRPVTWTGCAPGPTPAMMAWHADQGSYGTVAPVLSGRHGRPGAEGLAVARTSEAWR